MTSRAHTSIKAVLCHERVSRRSLPVNFDESDIELFRHEIERPIPETRLLEMRDVWASADGFLFRGGRMLPESFAFPFLREQWRARSLLKFFATNYLLRKRRTFTHAAAWIVDDWSYGYFHWLADALPRLSTIRERLDELVLLLPHRYEALEYVRSSLEAFGVCRVEFIKPDEVILCRRLYVPTHTAPSGHYNEEVIRGVRATLVESYGVEPARSASARLYISRSRAPKRKIVNEDEVVRVLREFDFQMLHAEGMSFAEQVRALSAARHLVSNHGAGLTNMLFMPPGGGVLELRHETDKVNNCYFTMASALDLDYFYQSCPPETTGEDAHTANLRVDAGALRENLKMMLEYEGRGRG